MHVDHDVPLRSLTTLRLGGLASRFVRVTNESDLLDALRSDTRIFILGGGSNVVFADDGFHGTIVQLATTDVRVTREADRVLVTASAGVDWDAFVARAISEGWSGIECLAGIPGNVGAVPIQNVGAYGQDVRETITRVRVFDRNENREKSFDRGSCLFSYRSSVFKSNDRYVVLDVTFALESVATSKPIAYAELARALDVREGERASLQDVRRAVLQLRRAKGMVLDAGDPDSVSAGSFFTNPIVSPDEFAAIEARAQNLGVLRDGERVPRFANDANVKTSAAWLIERAGFAKGFGEGRVGLSTKHTLAIVNRGGATTREVLAFAKVIQDGVRDRFGVSLQPEPVIVTA
jgi:UDP-N-acetylenolpyruvoylglucosamine reductase